MAFIPVPATAQVEIVNIYHNERVETVLHYTGGIVSDPVELTDLAGSVNLLWQTHVAPLVTDHVKGEKVVATDLSSATGPSVEVNNPVDGGIDAATSPSLPSNVAWSIKKSTAKRGRSFRGRIYHYGMVESQVGSNEVLEPGASDIEDAWGEFMVVTASGKTWTMQVVSRFSGGAPRVEGITTPVTAIGAVDRFVDSQRRRLAGRGD